MSMLFPGYRGPVVVLAMVLANDNGPHPYKLITIGREIDQSYHTLNRNGEIVPISSVDKSPMQVAIKQFEVIENYDFSCGFRSIGFIRTRKDELAESIREKTILLYRYILRQDHWQYLPELQFGQSNSEINDVQLLENFIKKRTETNSQIHIFKLGFFAYPGRLEDFNSNRGPPKFIATKPLIQERSPQLFICDICPESCLMSQGCEIMITANDAKGLDMANYDIIINYHHELRTDISTGIYREYPVPLGRSEARSYVQFIADARCLVFEMPPYISYDQNQVPQSYPIEVMTTVHLSRKGSRNISEGKEFYYRS
ncbi:uncharacterized protein TRIADDRAFT_51763 [Trichoplax adhaerens]|uniref:Uncharacterized protein n=1 Tax=Trichoplax adhaerens TaxID=10228 RepID=B3RKT9_TRIAD|nr:predicted protein [Trichoplax adhaerens]EDV28642.1 predicted protein [Trichoplax adhaerens]|eukprot:XP_002107844.1 predicted protein [Trichoplax adhaerens]